MSLKVQHMTRISEHADYAENDVGPSASSFILRYWCTESGHTRGYLLDVRSGIRHPVPDLAELPELVRSLIATLAESARDESKGS